MTEPTLVFDDDCGFCTWWAEFFEARSDIRTVGFSKLTPELRDRLPETYDECSHFVTDERVYSCGASIEEAFARSNIGKSARPLIEFLRNFEDYERVRERSYRHVADDRVRWGRLLSKTPPLRRGSEKER
ncbi:MAG: DCC1-like thiol-disulfide oxidoreductase family protein [Halalkalicoccus sp.]